MLHSKHHKNMSFKFLKFIFCFFTLLNYSTIVQSQTNNPCGATSLTVSTSCSYTAGTTVGTTYENDAANFGTPACASPGAPDAWYSFVAPTGGTVTITTQSGTMTDGAMALYSSATCATGTELACSDDVNGYMPEITQTGLTSGTTYYVRIWQYSSGTGTFNICITKPADPPSNDNCAGATSVTVNAGATCTAQTSGTVLGATASGNSLGACGGTADDDVWYQFVATNTSHFISLNNIAGSTTDLYHIVYNGTCGSLGTEILCSDAESSTLTGLTIGNTYYIRVYTYTSTTGQTSTFNLCITSPPANDECSGAYIVTANTGTTCTTQTAGTLVNATASAQSIGACGGTADDDVWFKFVATSATMTTNINNINGSTTDLYHTVYSGTCGSLGAEIICSDPNGNNLSGLTIGNTYYIRIYSYTSTTGQTSTFDVCILPTPPPPNNVTCNMMEPICSGSPTVFTAQADGSTAEPGPNYDCLATQPNPSWYYLEIDNPGLLSIDITASSDVDFAIWGPYTNLANAKAACGAYPLPLDCSYSTSATEQANVAGTTNGQVYVLLVTNYASVTQIINIDQSSSAVATTNCAIVLPVGMSLYDVFLDRKQVKIKWITDTELNNDYFDIQRSKDGKIWETIALKKGMGTITTQTNYEVIDEKPLEGISYYRIKQVDIDGKINFSPLKSIKNNPELEITVYPSPGKDIVKVNTNNKKLDTIEIVDLLGNVITAPYTIENGEYIYTISHLKKGIYTINMLVDGQKITRRLVKS